MIIKLSLCNLCTFEIVGPPLVFFFRLRMMYKQITLLHIRFKILKAQENASGEGEKD